MLADLLVNVGIAAGSVGGVGFTGIKALLQHRRLKRAATRKEIDKIRQRADRDHARTMKGDPRGMYGEYTPPREFVEIADDDQFIDEWDECLLCKQRNRRQAFNDKGKPLGPSPRKPVAVWSGTAEASVAPMRLCAKCYRECAYGSQYRDITELPIPKPATFMECLGAWLEAEKAWQARLMLWLNAEKRWKISGSRTDRSNVTNFQDAAKRLGHDMAVTAPRFAVGDAYRARERIADLTAKLAAAGVPVSAIEGYVVDIVSQTIGMPVNQCELGCDLCEKIYTHGCPTPTRLHCTGACGE